MISILICSVQTTDSIARIHICSLNNHLYKEGSKLFHEIKVSLDGSVVTMNKTCASGTGHHVRKWSAVMSQQNSTERYLFNKM